MKTTSKYHVKLLIAMLVVALASAAYAANVPVKLQAAIFLKVLAYDSNLSSRSSGGVVIAVVVDSGSSSQKNAILSQLMVLKSKSIQGKSVNIKAVNYSGQNLDSALGSLGANTIYIAAGSSDSTVNACVKAANAKRIPVLAGDGAMVNKGAAVGMAVEGGKPKILVNLKASRSQGMKLSAKVLQLAKVIK